ncbi:RDD family protein [Chloroflexota bacterium]
MEDASLDTADSSQQNVPRHQMEAVTNYAGFRKRFLAWIIDAVILIPLFFLPGYLYVEINDIVDAQQSAFWFYFFGIIVSAIYLVGFWTWRGQTPGKIVIRIVIVKSDGGCIDIGRAILRYIGYVVLVIIALILMIPVFFAFRWMLGLSELRGISMWVGTSLVPILVVLIPYWLTIALDRKKQGLHDKIAKTYVVKAQQAGILKTLDIKTRVGNQ